MPKRVTQKQLDRRTAKASESRAQLCGLLAAIVESSEDAIVSKNLNGIITSWNTAAQHIFGYTEVEAVGKPITILIPPELHDTEDKILEKLKAGERIEHYETIRVTKTGKRVDVSLTISPIKDSSGKITGFSKIARDITKQKLAEGALRASEEKLRVAYQAANIGTFEWNIQTGVNTWTPELEAMYGLPPGGFGGTQTDFENLVHPEDRPRVVELIEGALTTGQSTRGEWRVLWPDGSIHWIAGRWQVFMDASGEPSRMVGVNGDVTERKLAEEALRENEQRLRLAAQAGRMYSFEWDVRTGAVVRSPEYVTVLGATEQLRSTHRQFVDKIHPDDRSRFTATISALTPDNPTGIVTFRVVNPNGGLVWLRSSGHGIFDNQGRLRRVIGMVADVTDLKLAEEKLRASEERLRLAQWAARIGTFDLNMRTGVNVWTPETEAMYGLPPGTFGGTLAAFENLIHPDDRERMIDLTRDMVRTGQPVEGEWRVVWPDGSVRWIAGRGQVLMDEYGEPSRMLGVNLDITERKRAEETLAGMTRKLIESQEKDRARIGRDLHDDINQRLALLAVKIDQMRHNPRVSVAQFRSRLGEVRDRISEVASEVQSISHQLHSPQLEILGIVGAIRSLCKEYAAGQKVTIDFTHDDVPENVAPDISLCLFRVLQEALHNAVKHSNVRHYEVRLGCSENALHLTVSDRGTGFDAEAAMRSEGLGLVSMRERVRLVDGTIAIESSLMGGTAINVRVPFTSETRAERCVS